MENAKELPKGWANCNLVDFCSLNMGQSPDSSTYNDRKLGLPFYQGKTEFGNIHPEPVKYCSYPMKIGDIGDVLLSVRAPVGPTNLLNHKACIGRGLAAIKPLGQIESKFILYLFRSIEKELSSKGAGTTFKAITKEFLCDIKFKLPPLPEQQRIVAKLEELISELDAGVKSLKAAQQQLKVYRQAVLKWAFEGKLTEEWRKKQNKLLTVDELHELIKKERENKQKELCMKPKEVSPIQEDEMATLPELPSVWTWLKLCSLADIVGGITKGRDFKGKKTIKLPYLRVANVQDGYLDLREMKEIELLEEEKKKYLLEVNDILYTEGGDKDKLGRGTIWNGEISECVHQNHIFRARIYGEVIIPKYIAYYSQTKIAKNYFYKRAKQTVNLASINMTVLSNLPVAIPSAEEQGQVVQEIESRLSVCDKMEETIEQSLTKAEVLRQSILKNAFEGRLVPQDPNDEPAEKLLERIREEKAAQKPETKTTKRRANK